MTTNPALSIMDGIVSLEGDGPAMRGIPRNTGVIVGSKDPLSLDFAICRHYWIDPQRLFLI